MHRSNNMSKSTKRRRILEETAEFHNLLEGEKLNNLNTNVTQVCNTINILQTDHIHNNNDNFEPEIVINLLETRSHNINTIIETQNIVNCIDSVFHDSRYSDLNVLGINKSAQLHNMEGNLVKWAVDHNIPNNAFSGFLKIIKEHECFNNIPVDARTIFKTYNSTDVSNFTIPVIYKTVDPGIYHHFGIENGIRCNLDPHFLDKTIKLVIGVDGVPLAKSSGSTFWPILGYIRQSVQHVFPIGIYWGHEKPYDSNDFIKDFVEEAKHLILNGITIEVFNNNKLVNEKKDVVIDAFCCDIPARSFLIKTKCHTGFSSCSRCCVHGIHLLRRVCFPNLGCPKRTHQDFINQIQEEYHTPGQVSEIIHIPGINMIENFPLDYMHGVLLGVVKKLLTLLKGSGDIGRYGANNQKLPTPLIKKISVRLLSLRKSIPNDFCRKPRSLEDLSRWKATEFRQIAIYTGIVVLYSIIPKKLYFNFLHLYIAMRIFLSPNLNHLATCAQSLMFTFVTKFGRIYGKHYISSNVHQLIHLYDDFMKYGPLDQVSCFKFESYMLKLKKMVRKYDKPLQQVVNRYSENKNKRNLLVKDNNTFEIKPKFEKNHNEGPLISEVTSPQYKHLILENFMINITKDADSYVGVHKNDTFSIIKVVNICYCTNLKKEVILGRKFETLKCFFNKPIKSSEINIYQISDFSKKIEIWSIDDITSKYMVIPVDQFLKTVAIPIIHFNN